MQLEVTDIENIDEDSIDDWQPISVDEAFEFSRKPRSLDIPEDEPIPFIPMDGISESSRKLDYTESRKLDEIKSGSFVFKDDLLIAKITPSFENGKQAILDGLSNDYGYATTEVWVLHPKKEVKILKEYLFYYLRRAKIRSDLAGKMEGSTGRQRLPKGVLRNLELYSPPLNEQQEIVSILNTVQDAIEQTEAVIQATRELKKSMMKHLFTYGPVPVDQADQLELKECDFGRIPKLWEVTELKNICTKKTDTIEPANADDLIYVGLEHIRTGDTYLYEFGTPEEVNSTKNHFYSGDILYGKLRPYLDKCVIAESEGICSTDILVFRQKDEKAINKYLTYLLHTEPLLNHAIKTMSGVNHPRTSWNKIKNFMVPCPTLKVQKEIVSILDRVEAKVLSEIDKKRSLNCLYESLLENLMTAKIRVV